MLGGQPLYVSPRRAICCYNGRHLNHQPLTYTHSIPYLLTSASWICLRAIVIH